MPRFVIVVDTQVDFMASDGALSVAGAQGLAAPMAQWLAALPAEDTAGVLFTFDTHAPEAYAASPEAQAFPPHCLKGTPGWANVLDMGVVDSAIPVWRLEKGVFDMWEEPELMLHGVNTPGHAPRDPFFERLRASGVNEAVVIGVAADYCVRWAVAGLVARGFAVSVPAALTRGIARQIDQVAQEDFGGQLRVV